MLQIRQKKISNLEPHKIQDIIFDLGGVIVGLDTSRTIAAIARLTGVSEDEAFSIFESDKRFKEYEMGKITDEEFRNFIRDITTESLTDLAIDEAWNAMILGFPQVHLDLLNHLRKHYKIHLLSNTNNIHLEYMTNKLMEADAGGFSDYFDNEFYSHKMGMRKPNIDIYTSVLSEGGMNAESTLFLDDNLDNLKGAHSLGINVYHVKKLTDTVSFFNG
ncbi:MAG: HAD family phosphatase [Bacteroidota bacterium]